MVLLILSPKFIIYWVKHNSKCTRLYFFYVKPSYYQATLQKIPKYGSEVQQRPRTVPSWQNMYPILEDLNIV